MKQNGSRWFAPGLVAAVLAAGGCGGAAPLAEVEGTVTLKGAPLGNVQVEFLPDPQLGTTGPRSTGVTDEAGRFRLVSDDGRPGAAVGHHRVLVRDLNVYEGRTVGRDEAKPFRPSRVGAKYADSAATPLRVEVRAGGPPVELPVAPP